MDVHLTPTETVSNKGFMHRKYNKVHVHLHLLKSAWTRTCTLFYKAGRSTLVSYGLPLISLSGYLIDLIYRGFVSSFLCRGLGYLYMYISFAFLFSFFFFLLRTSFFHRWTTCTCTTATLPLLFKTVEYYIRQSAQYYMQNNRTRPILPKSGEYYLHSAINLLHSPSISLSNLTTF